MLQEANVEDEQLLRKESSEVDGRKEFAGPEGFQGHGEGKVWSYLNPSIFSAMTIPALPGLT